MSFLYRKIVMHCYFTLEQNLENEFQPLRLCGIVITRGGRVGRRLGAWAVGAGDCKPDNVITPRLRTDIFYPPPTSRDGGYCHHHVWPCVRVSFPDNISETVSRIAFILHTHIISLRGFRCAFWGL